MGERANILVVASEDGVLSFLKEALSSEGYDVLTARGTDSAIQTFKRERLDLLIADVFLPGLNGIELLKRVRAESPDMEVILFGRDAPIQTIVAAMKAGAYDYLEKPLEVERLKLAVEKALMRARLERENRALKRAADSQSAVPEIVCASRSMQEVLRTVDLVAPTDLTVLIEGESGVGKELVANRIHRRSPRASMPFVVINCGVVQGSLLESEFFGHERGAFTGAIAEHMGLVEVADKGTLFLDEIGEMALDLQVKLMRVLETGEFRRVGSSKVIRVDVRFIAATNRRLAEEVRKGRFREDLFYRLNVIRIEVPPLRNRPEEIPALVQAFAERGRRHGLREKRFTKDALEALAAYPWPGNVRELENLVERALILSPRDEITAADLPLGIPEGLPAGVALADDGDLTLAEVERRHIIRALRRNQGNKVRTAHKLGINVKTLYNKIKAYKIDEAVERA